jgi:hypothetical protein
MRLTDYFAGQEVRLRSPLSAQAAAERIGEAASNSIFRRGPFSPFRTGVVGRVWWGGHVRLRYRRPIDYSAKPILAGRILDAPPGSELRLRYRAPAGMYVFYPLWYFVLVGMAMGFSSGGFEPGISGPDKMMTAGIFVAFALVPPIFHAFGTWRSEEELAALIAFLSEHAEAEPDPRFDQTGLIRR